MKTEVTNEVLKAAPPAFMSWLTLNEWLVVVTVIYVVLQALYLARKWWREERDDWRAGK